MQGVRILRRSRRRVEVGSTATPGGGKQNEYWNPPLSPGGNTFTKSTHHINTRAQRWGEWGQVIEGGQINGEDYVVAHLLYAIHQGEGPRILALHLSAV